jgi:hypothetical protein
VSRRILGCTGVPATRRGARKHRETAYSGRRQAAILPVRAGRRSRTIGIREEAGISRHRYIGVIVCVSAASGAACGKVTLEGPADPVDAQVLVGDASPLQPDARPPAPDAQAVPDAAPPPDARALCIDGDLQREDPVTGACYMLFTTTPLGWVAARDACEALAPPAHLVSVTTAEEHGLAFEMIGARSVWMGASDRALEGEFRWVTGEPMLFTAWAPGEPNNGAPSTTPENCAILLNDDATRPGTWDDRACGSTRAYLCERE